MNTQHNILARYRSSSPTKPRTTLTIGGLVASLLVHGLLLAPLVWGGHHHRQRTPDIQGASANAQNQKSLESMLVVFVDDSDLIHDSSQDEDASSNHFLLPKPSILPIARPRISVAHLDLPEELDERTASEANGDQAGRSMLFGRYMGQISARIERAWIRPRSALATGSFECRAQITQDQHGNVQEVTLEECTADPRWQVSLVRAINAASPLPAPPDPAVFSNLMTLEFDSDPYTAGGSDEGFEPAARVEIAAAPQSIAAAPQSNAQLRPSTPSGRTIGKMRPDGSIDLTIIGSPSSTLSTP